MIQLIQMRIHNSEKSFFKRPLLMRTNLPMVARYAVHTQNHTTVQTASMTDVHLLPLHLTLHVTHERCHTSHNLSEPYGFYLQFTHKRCK